MADRGVGKKAKASVKGTPSRKGSKKSPSKTMVSPVVLKTTAVKRKVYQNTLDKILNVGKQSSVNYPVNSRDTKPVLCQDKSILPIIGKFTRANDDDVSFLPCFPGSTAPSTITSTGPAACPVGYHPLVATQTLGSVDSSSGTYPVATRNFGSVVTGRETLVPTQTQASVVTSADQVHSSTRECPTMEAPANPFFQSAEATRGSTQWSRLDNYDCEDVSVHPHEVRQGLPWPSPATIAPTVEPHYPLVDSVGGGGSDPPIVPLEPWHANDNQGDMEWQQEDEDYHYSRHVLLNLAWTVSHETAPRLLSLLTATISATIIVGESTWGILLSHMELVSRDPLPIVGR